ncbi:amino acid permease-domain-containing protein [Fusarium flagelliforme]|uniref:amino acid permease-domain-containing protein n=1 Tax=Fusarium flagelliforme TaxID=2675880 RepID=UPI001E8D80B1|nr:amino acid permease-domain-containing protein [Fusarium flagelliforme]KAH7184557.1 amino acid permease-domain-containing protein [Fusarium flagelliforme]
MAPSGIGSVVSCEPSPDYKPQNEDVDHQQTHLRKRFTLLSTIAFGFTTMNSWVAFASGLAVPLSCGAGPTLIYGLLVGGIIMTILAAGYAELASAFPSAGGQYHIVYMTFPASTRRFAAFFTGWMSILFFIAQSILNLSWHVYLVHICLSAIGNIGVSVLWLSIIGFIASLATLLSVQEVKQPSKFVFTEFTNVSGWTDGWAAMIGLASCLWAYCGIDAPSHLSEEVDNPSRNIPIAILTTIILGIITVITWNIGLMYVIKDVQGLIASGAPIMEVYNQALGSKTATTIWALYYILLFYHIILNLFVFSSRILWSFARDGGVPYSHYVSRLRWSNPVRATGIMLLLQIIIGILYIVSKTAYSSFINLTLFALNITVVLPQSVLLFTGRDSLPKRGFSLGRYGYLVNALATVFMLFFSVVFAFPVARPVTGSSMNYLVVIFALSLIFIVSSWPLGLSKRFTGPSEGTVHI